MGCFTQSPSENKLLFWENAGSCTYTANRSQTEEKMLWRQMINIFRVNFPGEVCDLFSWMFYDMKENVSVVLKISLSFKDMMLNMTHAKAVCDSGKFFFPPRIKTVVCFSLTFRDDRSTRKPNIEQVSFCVSCDFWPKLCPVQKGKQWGGGLNLPPQEQCCVQVISQCF